jgi:16S rRNA (uracil1498-N3)-methyltransferase
VRLSRVYCESPLVAETEVALPASAANHVARVLRLRAGAPIVAFDGSGNDYQCEILAIEGRRVRVRVGAAADGRRESPLAVTLVQAVSRGERMDLTLQKATELGVRAVVPVFSMRSVVRLDERQAAAKLRHWQAVVTSACEQCGRSVLPKVHTPLELDRYLADSPRDGLRLVPSPGAPDSLAGLGGDHERVDLLIGPEGGFDEHELLCAEGAGFKAVRLGPRVLRTETAGIVALALLQARWGDLR